MECGRGWTAPSALSTYHGSSEAFASLVYGPKVRAGVGRVPGVRVFPWYPGLRVRELEARGVKGGGFGAQRRSRVRLERRRRQPDLYSRTRSPGVCVRQAPGSPAGSFGPLGYRARDACGGGGRRPDPRWVGCKEESEDPTQRV